MPAYQTTYANNLAPGYVGMIADTEFTTVLSAEVQTAPVGFGLAATKGTIAETARLGGTIFHGISVADKANLNAAGTGYAVGDTGGFMAKGCIWVSAANTVAITDPVTFTAATGVIGAGLVTTIANARFLDAGTVGTLVRVLLL